MKSGATSKPESGGGTAWRCATGWNRSRSVLLVHVHDGRLVEQDIRAFAAVHFETAAVVPLNHAVQCLAIAQDEHHRGLGLHLLHVIKILGVSLIRWDRFLLQGRAAGRSDLLLHFVQRRTDKFAIDSFHGMPSFDEIMTGRRYALPRRGCKLGSSGLHP